MLKRYFNDIDPTYYGNHLSFNGVFWRYNNIYVIIPFTYELYYANLKRFTEILYTSAVISQINH